MLMISLKHPWILELNRTYYLTCDKVCVTEAYVRFDIVILPACKGEQGTGGLEEMNWGDRKMIWHYDMHDMAPFQRL